MKKGVAILLAAVLTLTSCGTTQVSEQVSQETITTESDETTSEANNLEDVNATEEVAKDSLDENDSAESGSESIAEVSDINLDTYASYESVEDQIIAGENLDLSDERLQRYIQDKVYVNTLRQLDSSDYCIDSIETVYYSQEYIDQLTYNSNANIYFGYSQAELDEQFPGKKYVFTLDEDTGETTVVEVESYEDHTTEKVLKNVAIGAGVILVCVTVSTVTATAAPAVSVIFAFGAASGKALAISGALYGGITSGIIQGYQTGNFTDALSSAAVGASEGFKWGALIGSATGAASEALTLHGLTAGGLTMDEAAMIQRESQYSLEFISELHSMEEYELYANQVGLRQMIVDGKSALVRDIDWAQTSIMSDGSEVTNLWRAQHGYAPLDPNGIPYELHHVNQNADGTLAILTQTEHRGKGVYSILHDVEKTGVHNTEQGISATVWNQQKKSFWKDLAAQIVAQ